MPGPEDQGVVPRAVRAPRVAEGGPRPEAADILDPEGIEGLGEEVVRVWRLYLVGGSMAFRDGRMGVDQILMVRPGAAHTLPAVRGW